jgi:hypothetical protein
MQERSKPVKARAIDRATKIFETSEPLLQEAEAILQRALDQDETLAATATALDALNDCTDDQHDITASFVQLTIWDMCNDLWQTKAGP